jgi:hypothetical protein
MNMPERRRKASPGWMTTCGGQKLENQDYPCCLPRRLLFSGGQVRIAWCSGGGYFQCFLKMELK